MEENGTPVMESLITTMGHEARLVRHAALAYTDARGSDGLQAVRRALGELYAWKVAAAQASGAGSLQSIVEAWGSADLLALNPTGWGSLAISDNGLRLLIFGSPELQHYTSHGVGPFAAIHYGELVRQLATAVGAEEKEVEVCRSEGALRISFGSLGDGAAEPGVDPRGPAGSQLLGATSANRGALIVFLGRAAERAFGADGEEMFRVAIRGFGAERGDAMRLSHLTEDRSLDLTNMMKLYDSGGNEDVWQYRDEGVLTPSEWTQDCTFCPFVQAWKDLDGLRYGEIYDHEFHVSQFKAYQRDIQVRWGQLQSRGDATCEFRFSMPRLSAAGL